MQFKSSFKQLNDHFFNNRTNSNKVSFYFTLLWHYKLIIKLQYKLAMLLNNHLKQKFLHNIIYLSQGTLFHVFSIYILFLTLWLQSFLYPSDGTEIFFYKLSPGMDFFQCLLFGTDFFLWYSCILGWELKLRPLSTVQGKCTYTIFNAENQEIQSPLSCTKPSIDKHKFLSFIAW